MMKEENYLPAGLIDTSMPTSCVLIISETPLVLVTQSDNVRIDAQRMFTEYRNLTDAGVLRNKKVAECRKALDDRNKKNLKILSDYCLRKGMKGDPSSFTCTR